jgi:IS30 family transposase
MILNRVSISNRDSIADEKKKVGHFEVVLTFHKNNRSANILAMISKTSKKAFYVLIEIKLVLPYVVAY